MAKKTKEESTETVSKLQETLDKLNKQYGKGTILTLDSKDDGVYDTISTGSIGFDYITLGIGGFVKGKLYELIGWEGSGKSTICGHATAECQKKGGKVAYIDGENAVDMNYFKQLGVKTEEMLIIQPTTGEDGFNIAIELIKSGEVDLIIMDSDNSLLPKSVVEGEVGDSALGKKARLNNTSYPKIKPLLNQYNTCMIVVSQLREKIGVMFGSPETTSGGHALKFYTDCRLDVRKSLVKEGDETYGTKVKIKAIKNKVAAPYKVAEFEVHFGKGIDKKGEIIKLATDFEIITKWGSKITWGENKMELSEFEKSLDNCEFWDQLKANIINKIKNTDIAVEEPVEKEED
jgi:recombination protein RecA